jgi:hypothetical protein
MCSGRKLLRWVNESDEGIGRLIRRWVFHVSRVPRRQIIVGLQSTRHVEELPQGELRIGGILGQIRAERCVDRNAALRFELKHCHGGERLRDAADLIEARRRHPWSGMIPYRA